MSTRVRSVVLVVTTAAAACVALGAIATPAYAETRTRTITVVGTGEVHGTPDVADLVIGVSGRAGSATDVLSRISDKAQKLIDALKGAGVGDDDIQTTDLSVQPVQRDGEIRVDAGVAAAVEGGGHAVAEVARRRHPLEW